MLTPTIEPSRFDQKAREIRSRVSKILTKWGLLPRFSRWRLTQDLDSGLVVLFGILNNRYIAAHTSTPFREYFDARVLHDLANELQVEVVSCNSDGLRYAFILDRAGLARIPTHIDFPFIDNGKPLIRVVYSEIPPPVAAPPVELLEVDDHTLVHQGVGAFLKVFDDIKIRDEAIFDPSHQGAPDFVVIDQGEFDKQVAELEVLQRRRKQTGRLSTKAAG
jgi:hypothetical protein